MLSYSWTVWLTLLTSLLFIQSPPFKASMWTHFIYLKRMVNTTFLSPDIIFTGKLPEFQLIEKKHMRWRFIPLIPSLLLIFSLRWRQVIMNDRLMQSKKSLPKTCITVCPFFQRKLIFHCAFKQNFSPKSPAISVSRPRGRARYACRFIAVCYAKFVVIRESESHNGNMKNVLSRSTVLGVIFITKWNWRHKGFW